MNNEVENNIFLSKKSKKTMNVVDGLILKNLTGLFRKIAKDNNEIMRTLDSNGEEDKNLDIEKRLDFLIEEELIKKEKLKENLNEIIRIKEKKLSNSISSTSRKSEKSNGVKEFDPSTAISRNGSIYLSKYDQNLLSNNENINENNYQIPENDHKEKVFVPMPTNEKIKCNYSHKKVLRRSIDNLLRKCNSNVINDKIISNNAVDGVRVEKEKSKNLFKDDHNLKKKNNFKKEATLRRSISESNLLDETPVVENQLLKRHLLKENSNYWTPLDVGGKHKKDEIIKESEIKHILPINATHTYVQKKGFNIRCCYCKVRKFVPGEKLACITCGIEMHLGCHKVERNVPCVVMEKRRKIEQSKYPVYLGKICTTARPMIPAVLIRLIDRIETSSMLTTSGLYCHDVNKENDQNTLRAIVEEKFYIMFEEKSLFLIPNALRRLLSNLAEAIIPPSSWGDVCIGVKRRDYRTVYKEILNLPVTNKDTLAFLIRHFQIVLNFSDKNKMTLSNIVETFATNIVGLPKFRMEKYGNINDCVTLTKAAMTFLIEVSSEFWDLILRTSTDPPLNVFLNKFEIQTIC
uniref:Rho-GAP domain-containing protein n=1 Tax=Parastrongyloides trichosuri TaxID=131310 RepID=A0A0N4ZNV3_PARTI